MKKLKINKKKGITFWITGYSGAGKTTIARLILKKISQKYGDTILVNGDDIRSIFNLDNYDMLSRYKYARSYSKL